MACSLTTGRKVPCKSAVGGIKTIYFADYGTLGAATIVSGEITALAGTPVWDDGRRKTEDGRRERTREQQLAALRGSAGPWCTVIGATTRTHSGDTTSRHNA